MSDVFYLRPIDPPIAPADVIAMGNAAGGCFGLHSVRWQHSFLSADGGRLMCWYAAPDAESARIALRQLGADLSAVWPGKPVPEGADAATLCGANLIAEFVFDAPRTDALLGELEAELDRWAVTRVGRIVSTDRRRVVHILEAAGESALPDASVPEASRASVWRCTSIRP